MAAREVLMVVIESSYGTPKSTPSLGTDKFYMRLDTANSFTMEATPVQSSIPYGGGYNVEADTVSDTVQCTGNFSFLVYPGVWSSTLLNWAITPINAGRTTPWTTTDASSVMPVGDLASLSFYHAILTEDGSTYKRTRYAGVKCNDWSLTASEQGDARMWRLTGSASAIRPLGNPWDSSTDPDATEFPLPADADYPTGPYTLSHLASGTGTLTIGSGAGTSRTAQAMSVTVSARNTMASHTYTTRFPVTNHFLGRASQCVATMRYKASPDDRGSARSLTAQTMNFLIDNGTHTVGLNFNGNNVIRPYVRDLPMTDEYQQTLTLVNRYSTSAGGDITLTTT